MLIDSYKEQIYSCGRCGYCLGGYLSHICPSRFIGGFESATARGRLLIARAILEGELRYTNGLSSMLFTCFLCGACDSQCEKAAKIKIAEITKSMRSDASAIGVKPEKLVPIANALCKMHNIYREPPEKRVTLIKYESGKDALANLLYFPGCVISYRHPQIAQNILQILKAAGLRPAMLGEDEWCCGNPLLTMGMEDAAEKTMKHNIEKIIEKGVKTVLTSCPGCYRTMMQDYPKVYGGKLPFKIVHATQFLNELICSNAIALDRSEFKHVTYHDPCEIGRYFKIYEEPRNIIQKVSNVQLIEMPRNREYAWCCGGGGNVNVVHTHSAFRVAELRIFEATKTGAETLVTACPSCVHMLKLASKRKRAGIRVIDISEFVLASMCMPQKPSLCVS